jgi:pilus assembly protein CpaB
MRNKALFLVLTGAVVFGLLAAMSVSRFISRTQSANLNTVVIAKVEIPIGAKIIEEQLTTVQTPRNATPEGTFDSPAKVVGRVSLSRIAAREPVTTLRLAQEGVTAGLSAIIPEGYRAMTVAVDDETGISGFVQPGALVDVLAVVNSPEQAAGGPISKIVLQNIKVLANGENLDEPRDQREANRVRTVTLQVTPEQAEKLALSSYDGKLRLALRNSVDQGDEQTKGATKRTLLTGEPAVIAPAPGALKEAQVQTQAQTPRRPVERRRPPRIIPPFNQPAGIPQIPAKPRISVEVFEGLKKRTVEFP